MKRVALLLSAFAIAFAAGATHAQTAAGPALDQARATVGGIDVGVMVDDQGLDSARGGLVQAGGVLFSFGAVVKSYVDGQLALQSTVNWTPEGAVRTVNGAAGSDAPASLTVEGQGGETTLIQDLTQGRVANMVLNTANNRNITQSTFIGLGLPDFAQTQAGLDLDRMRLRIDEAMSLALRDATIR